MKRHSMAWSRALLAALAVFICATSAVAAVFPDSSIPAALWNVDRYQKGDLNFDRIVDLGDAYLLHQAFIAAGSGSFSIGDLVGTVPEPGSLSPWTIAVGVSVSGLCRRQRVATQRVSEGGQA